MRAPPTIARLGPLPLAGVFALGLVVGGAGGGGAGAAGVVVAIAAIVGAAARAIRGRTGAGTWGLIALAVAALGVARGVREAREAAAPFPGADDRALDRVRGRVGAPVIRTPLGWGAPLATADGVAWMYVDAATRPRPGQEVIAAGLVHAPRGARGVGQVDREAALAARGARVELVAQDLAVLDDAPDLGERAWRWADDLRDAGARALDDAGGDPIGVAALRGIALGDRGDVPPALDDAWRTVGIFHVLSVSGLHLAIVAGLAYGLLRRAVALVSARATPARWAAPPALALAIAYTLITGAQLATVRALAVVAIALVGAALARPVRARDALGLAALAILAWRPADLLDPSFQLSFTAALVLALRHRARPQATPSSRLARGVRAVGRGIATSIWIALATAPITAYHFQQVQLGGALGNVALAPALELVALPLALGGLVIHAAWPIRAASAIVALVDRGARVLARVMPVGAIAVARPGVMVALVAVAVALAAWEPGRRGRRALVALAVVGWLSARATPPPGALRVTFLDVGQGDAALLELPTGEVWLIDAGGSPAAPDPIRQRATGAIVARALRATGHDRIDLAIVSHPHPDHYLGLAGLVDAGVPIGVVWSARELAPPGDRGATGFAAAVAATGAPLEAPPLGVARVAGGVELVVLGPRYVAAAGAAPVEAADPVRSVNDNSLAVAIRYAGRTLVFAGDVEAEGEAALADALAPGGADVVKVAHHGSPTSSTAALIAAAHPRLAVISCGRANRFGFPSPAVVARWEAAGARVRRTDRDGSIVVAIDPRGEIEVDGRDLDEGMHDNF